MEKNEAKELLDLTLHPVRMRILMLLSGSSGITPQQIAEQMRDIPQATLYRHINQLAQSGLLVVVEERPARGTLEKVYALNIAKYNVDDTEALSQMSKEEHLRYFTAFMMTLLDDFSRYLKRSETRPLDYAADGIGYQKMPLFLSDQELGEFASALNQAMAPFLKLENTPGRQKRLFTTVMMPAYED